MARERNMMLSNSLCACVSSLVQDNRGEMKIGPWASYTYLWEVSGTWL